MNATFGAKRAYPKGTTGVRPAAAHVLLGTRFERIGPATANRVRDCFVAPQERTRFERIRAAEGEPRPIA
jgi:hypothetical protein